MNADIKERWLAALESGDYVQCKSVLRRDTGGHCCLGVLCDIHAKEGLGEWGDAETIAAKSYGGHVGHPPNSVYEWAGLPEVSNLIKINDAAYDFSPAIAYIRENL